MATKKQKRKKSIRSRFEALKREGELVDVLFCALTTMTDEHATAWLRKATRLEDGLSAAAIERALTRAHKMADDMPPGHLRAMEAMDDYEEICRERRISKRDQDDLWGAVAQLCMFQLASKRGPFYDAACDFRLVPASQEPTGIVVERPPAPRPAAAGTCDCPECRPRKPEELN